MNIHAHSQFLPRLRIWRDCSLEMEGGRKRRSFSLISSSVRPSKRYRVYEGGERERVSESEREGAKGGREIINRKCINMVKQMQLVERERRGWISAARGKPIKRLGLL